MGPCQKSRRTSTEVKDSKDKTLSSGQLLGHHLQLPCLNASLHISPRPRRPHAPLYRHDSVCVRPLLERRRCWRKHRPGRRQLTLLPVDPRDPRRDGRHVLCTWSRHVQTGPSCGPHPARLVNRLKTKCPSLQTKPPTPASFPGIFGVSMKFEMLSLWTLQALL